MVRVSGGHLCEAEAPTEPANEAAARCAAIRFPPLLVIAKPCKRLRQSVFPFKGITDSFALRAQNDKPFSHCEAVQTAAAIRPLTLSSLRGALAPRQSVFPASPVIAVRVSGGHLCKAEAPTEPAGETAVRCTAIRSPCHLRYKKL